MELRDRPTKESRTIWDNRDIVRDHPELHHYTTIDGLAGITATRSLWATDYRELNDAQELTAIRQGLRRALRNSFIPMFRQEANTSLALKRRIERQGGYRCAAKNLSDRMISALDTTTLPTSSLPPGTIDYRESVFITSFCSHCSDHDSYERENGLLSQWRGYGQNGGVCIVFHTEGLLDRLTYENNSFLYEGMHFEPVHYLLEDDDMSSLNIDLIATCEQYIRDLMAGREPEERGLFWKFVAASARCKHRGFREEREVRIVVRPCNEATVRAHSNEKGRHYMGQLKVVVDEPPKRRVILFDTLGAALPIRRVIVGPGADQQRQINLVREIVGRNIPVTASNTPYRAA